MTKVGVLMPDTIEQGILMLGSRMRPALCATDEYATVSTYTGRCTEPIINENPPSPYHSAQF